MAETLANERGSALVMTLGALGGLLMLAVIVVSVVTSGKWTEFREYTHTRAFYSADAGGEAALNWIRFQNTPPPILDAQSNVFVAASYTSLSDDHDYKYDIQFARKRFRPGWSLEYKDYEYLIKANGASADSSEAVIELRAMRLYEEGY
jgi:hypothetical protein